MFLQHANGPDSNGENAQRAAEEEEGLDPDDKEEVDIAEGEQDTEEAATDKSVQLKSQQSPKSLVYPQSIKSSLNFYLKSIRKNNI